jgi:hypothetical protein
VVSQHFAEEGGRNLVVLLVGLFRQGRQVGLAHAGDEVLRQVGHGQRVAGLQLVEAVFQQAANAAAHTVSGTRPFSTQRMAKEMSCGMSVFLDGARRRACHRHLYAAARVLDEAPAIVAARYGSRTPVRCRQGGFAAGFASWAVLCLYAGIPQFHPYPFMRNLVVVLGDQLSLTSVAFEGFDAAQDRVWMAEVREESSTCPAPGCARPSSCPRCATLPRRSPRAACRSTT